MTATSQAIGRLLNQFSDSFDLQAFVEEIFARLEDTNSILDDLLNKRALDTATGVWLDILGVIVGVERPYKEVSASNIFTFKDNAGDPDDPDKAFYDPGGGPSGGYYQSHEGLRDPSGDLITDTEYRKVVKAKAIGNHVIGNIEDITRFINEGFGPLSHVTEPDAGEIEVELVTALTQGERRMVERYAPKAGGVNITITNWP
jgi:hypothetical protein